MAKIKDFNIILEKEELSKDEIINNLRNEVKELKNKLNSNSDSSCCCCFILLFIIIFIFLFFRI